MLGPSHKMLLRKCETSSAILAVALLVAILASANAVVNYINFQTESLGSVVNIVETYLILDRSSTSIIDSEIDASLADQLKNIVDVNHALPQRVLTATLTTNSGNHTVSIRGIEDVRSFLKVRRAHVDGTTAKSKAEANVGEILAQIATVNLGDQVSLIVGRTVLKVKVVGIVRTLTETDTEIIVPMEAVNYLTEKDGKISLVEFTLKERVSSGEAINRIIELLPKGVKVVRVQQLGEFLHAMNSQTLGFLNVWSLAVYAMVAAASYVVATRLITESSYELTMLKALGAKKKHIFALVLTYTVSTVTLGSILGIALGIVGAQAASTVLRWTWSEIEVAPFLETGLALQIIVFALSSSILGCLWPAFRAAPTRYMEQPL